MQDVQSRRQARAQPNAQGRILAVSAVLGIVAFLQLPVFNRGIVPIDEGQLVQIGERILRGEVLYRDIYTGIFPGIYYTSAGILGVFGADVAFTRIAQAAINVATALFLYWIGSGLMRRPWSFMAPLLYGTLVVVSFPVLTFLSYSPLSLLFALAAVWATLRYLRTGARITGAAIGFALAGCALTKQNYGAFTGFPIVVALTFLRAGSPLKDRSVVRVLGPVATAGAVCTLLVLGPFFLVGAGTSFVEQTMVTLFRAQMDAFNQPIPPIFGPHPDDGRFTFFYLPSALFGYLMRGEPLFGVAMSETLRSAVIRSSYGLTLAVLVMTPVTLLSARTITSRRGADTLFYVLFAELMFLGIFPSAIWSHLATVLAPILVLGPLLCARLEAVLGTVEIARRLLRAAAGLLLAVALVLSAQVAFDIRRWHPEPLGLERGSLYVVAEQAQLLRGATDYLKACAAEGEPVFVAPDMPILYFLSDRPNPTAFDLIIPGAIDTQEIIARLESTQTRCAVYNPRMYAHFDAFDVLFPDLAVYLSEKFRTVVEIGPPGANWLGLVRVESAA